MSTAAIIVAAGRGRRAGPGLPKQWRELGGRTVLSRTLETFRSAPQIGPIVLVLAPDDMGLAAGYAAHPDVRVATGGTTRDASVRAGLEALADSSPERVLIHDGARPLVDQGIIARVCAALDSHPGAAPALAVNDALWRASEGRVGSVVNRDELFRAQTPQGFHFPAILAAHRAHPGGAADDVEIARAAGIEVAIVEGAEHNLKITTAADFARAEMYLAARERRAQERTGRQMDIRTGNGFDVHAFSEGDHVVLCGVRIPYARGLKGHSDADVGMHALTDAIYGALAEGDIGRHFPPSDPQWKGADSRIFLEHALARARARGYVLSNADLTLICEEPRIGPHAPAMARALAEIAGTEAGRISVKATTSERLGFTGRGEGIAALASVTLVAP